MLLPERKCLPWPFPCALARAAFLVAFVGSNFVLRGHSSPDASASVESPDDTTDTTQSVSRRGAFVANPRGGGGAVRSVAVPMWGNFESVIAENAQVHREFPPAASQFVDRSGNSIEAAKKYAGLLAKQRNAVVGSNAKVQGLREDLSHHFERSSQKLIASYASLGTVVERKKGTKPSTGDSLALVDAVASRSHASERSREDESNRGMPLQEQLAQARVKVTDQEAELNKKDQEISNLLREQLAQEQATVAGQAAELAKRDQEIAQLKALIAKPAGLPAAEQGAPH